MNPFKKAWGSVLSGDSPSVEAFIFVMGVLCAFLGGITCLLAIASGFWKIPLMIGVGHFLLTVPAIPFLRNFSSVDCASPWMVMSDETVIAYYISPYFVALSYFVMVAFWLIIAIFSTPGKAYSDWVDRTFFGKGVDKETKIAKLKSKLEKLEKTV